MVTVGAIEIIDDDDSAQVEWSKDDDSALLYGVGPSKIAKHIFHQLLEINNESFNHQTFGVWITLIV